MQYEQQQQQQQQQQQREVSLPTKEGQFHEVRRDQIEIENIPDSVFLTIDLESKLLLSHTILSHIDEEFEQQIEPQKENLISSTSKIREQLQEEISK